MSDLPEPRELDVDAAGSWVRHWQHPAWIDDVQRWVAGELDRAGFVATGPGVTYKLRFWSVVRYHPTDRGLVWFKENNPGQGFEARLVDVLARLVPDLVVPPLATRADHGWLLSTDQGRTLGDTGAIGDQRVRELVIDELARLHRTAAAHGDALRAAGLTEVGPATAGPLVRDRVARLGRLPDAHLLRPSDDVLEQLGRAADRLDEVPSGLRADLPLTLEHNDPHAFNVFDQTAQGTVRFFDFGDAVWGHPLVTVRSFLDSLGWTADLSGDHPDVAALLDRYLASWSDVASPEDLRHDYGATAGLAPVARMVSWFRLLDHADATEIAARAEIPRFWLEQVAALAD